MGFIRAVVEEITPYQQRVAEVGWARCTDALHTGVLHGHTARAPWTRSL
jgi:hypothetical protein